MLGKAAESAPSRSGQIGKASGFLERHRRRESRVHEIRQIVTALKAAPP